MLIYLIALGAATRLTLQLEDTLMKSECLELLRGLVLGRRYRSSEISEVIRHSSVIE